MVFAGQTVEVTSNKSITEQKDDSFTNMTGNSHYVVDCDGWGFFSDRPGNHKPYMNGSDYYTTICADDSKKGVTVSFQQFAIEKFDKLSVWDEYRKAPVGKDDTPEKLNVNKSGKDDGVDFIGSYNLYASPGTITSKRGCLTFRFVSDATVVKTGWYGKIGCANRPTTDPCKTFNSRVDSELKCGVEIKDDNYRGANNYESYGDCTMKGWESDGRELIYKFVNYKASDLTFTLKEMNGSQPKVLNMHILNDCKPSACVDAITRPAPNPKQDVESVTIKNAPAGTYYVVVDGNTKYAHNWFKLSVECAGGDYTTCKDPYYYDDFEAEDPKNKRPHRPDVDYKVGDYITRVNPYWFKSDNVGIRDARISNDRSSNGKQSLEINRNEEATQDVFLDLGRKFKGVYRLCFNMYIEAHSTAFFGIFGGDNSDPWGSISKEFGHNNGMEGRWFDVEIFIDLDKNRYTMYMDNRCQSVSGEYLLNIDAINFYGLPKAHFYVDHICFGPVKRIPPAGSISRIAIDMETPLYETAKSLQIAANVPTFASDTEESAAVSLAVDKLNADDLKVMPNPTTGVTLIALDLEQEQTVNLQIFSPAGQMVRNIPLGKTAAVRQEVNLGDLSNGLYILRATGEQSVITKKIILQR